MQACMVVSARESQNLQAVWQFSPVLLFSSHFLSIYCLLDMVLGSR